MKKLIITSTLFAFAAMPVFAQTAKKVSAPSVQQTANEASVDAKRIDAVATRQAKTFEQQYKLTPEQYKGVYAACYDFTKKMEENRHLGRQITTADVNAILAEKNAKFKAVMTPAQYAAYESTLAKSAPQPLPTQTKSK